MKLGYYNPYMLTGTVLMAVGCGLMSTFNASTSHQYWIPYQVLMGLSGGMIGTMPLIAVQTVVRDDQIPVATAMVILFQFFGGSVWLAVAQAVLQNKLINALSILARETGGAVVPEKILQIGAGFVGASFLEWNSVKGRSLIPGEDA
jgi:hypothetical protein